MPGVLLILSPFEIFFVHYTDFHDAYAQHTYQQSGSKKNCPLAVSRQKSASDKNVQNDQLIMKFARYKN